MLLDKLKSLFSSKKEPETKQGTIKFFNRRKGFGFIQSQDNKDVFVHVTELRDKVRQGDRVQFELDHAEAGLKAKNVELIQS